MFKSLIRITRPMFKLKLKGIERNESGLPVSNTLYLYFALCGEVFNKRVWNDCALL